MRVDDLIDFRPAEMGNCFSVSNKSATVRAAAAAAAAAGLKTRRTGAGQ